MTGMKPRIGRRNRRGVAAEVRRYAGTMSRLIDLSHIIEAGMVTYPGLPDLFCRTISPASIPERTTSPAPSSSSGESTWSGTPARI